MNLLLLLLLLRCSLFAALPGEASANGEWKLLLRQTAGLWQAATKWESVGVATDPTSPNFSILSTVNDAMKGPQGFTFKLKYPKDEKGRPLDGQNVWTQPTPPTTAMKGCNKPVTGYSSISNSFGGKGFSGLQQCSCSKGQALVCNHNRGDDWWYALGTAGPFEKRQQFPGPGKPVTQVELWICLNSDNNCLTIGEDITGGAGFGIPFLLWGFLGCLLYIAVGLIIGKRRDSKTSTRRGGLALHPHYPHWTAFHGLVMDGMHFALDRHRRGDGPDPAALVSSDADSSGGGGGRRGSSASSTGSKRSKSSKRASKTRNKTSGSKSKTKQAEAKPAKSASRRNSKSEKVPPPPPPTAAPAPSPVNLGRQMTQMTDAFGNALRR